MPNLNISADHVCTKFNNLMILLSARRCDGGSEKICSEKAETIFLSDSGAHSSFFPKQKSSIIFSQAQHFKMIKVPRLKMFLFLANDLNETKKAQC